MHYSGLVLSFRVVLSLSSMELYFYSICHKLGPMPTSAWWIGFFVLCQLFYLPAALPSSFFFPSVSISSAPFFSSRFRHFLALFFGCFYCASEGRRFFGIKRLWSSDYAIALFVDSAASVVTPLCLDCFQQEISDSASCYLALRLRIDGRVKWAEEKASLVPSILTLALASRVLFRLDFSLFFCFFRYWRVSGALERKKRIWHLDWTFGMSCQEAMLLGWKARLAPRL